MRSKLRLLRLCSRDYIRQRTHDFHVTAPRITEMPYVLARFVALSFIFSNISWRDSVRNAVSHTHGGDPSELCPTLPRRVIQRGLGNLHHDCQWSNGPIHTASMYTHKHSSWSMVSFNVRIYIYIYICALWPLCCLHVWHVWFCHTTYWSLCIKGFCNLATL